MMIMTVLGGVVMITMGQAGGVMMMMDLGDAVDMGKGGEDIEGGIEVGEMIRRSRV